MRSGSPRRLVAVVGPLAVSLAACSSGGADEPPGATAGNEGAAAGNGCAAAAGVSGLIEDRGTAEASGGAITLDASEFAFSPTASLPGAPTGTT